MSDNMFTQSGWEKVVYCEHCKRSFRPIHVPAKGNPVIIGRFCEITNRLVRDDDYCSRGVRRVVEREDD